MTPGRLPEDWREALAPLFAAPWFAGLREFVDAQRASHEVFPTDEDVFNAFRATPLARVKVLLLGQDPYHGPGQAHGMCFSVRPGVKPPPSLVNMLKELKADQGCPIPPHGYLGAWAERGVLLLNAVLTVRRSEPNSHKDKGWEKFTDGVIEVLNAREAPVVFALWGGFAQKKAKKVSGPQHRVVTAAHPSPLSAAKFLGAKPYSAINAALEEVGTGAIDWCLPTEAAPA